MALKTEILVRALQGYRQRHGHGAWTRLARGSGLSQPGISRIASGKVTPSLSTWLRLHEAFPLDIPPAEIEQTPQASGFQVSEDAPGEVIGRPPAVIPVFDAGAGEPSHFTDKGYPVGVSDEVVAVFGGVDDNSFGVRIHGDSMTPYLRAGDIAVVVPSASLANGKLCFASWPGDEGRRVVKRFYRYGDTIVLRSDNPAHEDITLSPENSDGVRIYRVTQSIRYE